MRSEERYPHWDVTSRIIGCGVEVHRKLGPSLLESLYQRAMEIEMRLAGLRFERERRFQVHYKGRLVGEHRADFDVEECVILEAKAVESLLPIYDAIAYSYLRVSRRPIALIINFHVAVLRDGIHRLVNKEALP